MDALRNIVVSVFSATSIWSVIARAAIWFLVAGVIIASSNSPKPEEANKKLRNNLGFFLLFLVLSSGLVFLLFSYVPASATN